MAYASLLSPLGTLTPFAENGALVALEWGEGGLAPTTAGHVPPPDRPTAALLAAAIRHLGDYFAGRPLPADLPLDPAGTAYQRRVWRAIAAIPFAATRSYGDLAMTLDSGPRAIATACARNPLPLFIPCHRVVAADGRLGGYSGGDGPATKRALLALEAAAAAGAG